MTIDKEILVYASTPFKKFRFISTIAAIQVGFVTLNLFLMPNSKQLNNKKQSAKKLNNTGDEELDKETTAKDNDDSKGFLSKILDVDYRNVFKFQSVVENVKDRPFITLALTTCSSLVLAATFYLARRSIHTIHLLPNEKVKFQFFSPYALREPPTLVTSLRNVSCQAPRKSKHNYSILKLRGYKGYHLVHKVDGHFFEPKLYDKYLGYSRSWSEK